ATPGTPPAGRIRPGCPARRGRVTRRSGCSTRPAAYCSGWQAPGLRCAGRTRRAASGPAATRAAKPALPPGPVDEDPRHLRKSPPEQGEVEGGEGPQLDPGLPVLRVARKREEGDGR